MNQIRAMLAEFGIIVSVDRHALQRAIPDALEDADNQLPDLARAIISDCFEHLLNLNQRIADQEQCFDMLVSRSRQAKKIMKVAGIGPITAAAVTASIGRGEQFDKGRDFMLTFTVPAPLRGLGTEGLCPTRIFSGSMTIR
ncbi:transposase [Photobacterium sp. CAU 1568]|uniref:Transposase n=1 Tax=Photobacterium arenosum TaxID=2774143 RepID=A0ABR9BPR4_9GAMM|nr:transposase [Photobacterium arenosum]MBD8514219.1 transposase [Photobacterium arenosum]